MPIEKNILIAFILNLAFSLFEFFGGLFTHSVAILSDSIHDLGDAISIGLSYFLERKSQKKPDQNYTFGYRRYSIIGGAITTSILIVGSLIVIYQAIGRIIHPVAINYDGMLLFAIFGVIVNFFAAYFTREGNSLNQKAVNLHMLEDVLGWVAVLLGAVIMRFTNWSILDPILSIGVAIFILIHALKNFQEIINLFLEKTPPDINIDQLKQHLLKIKGVGDIHHIHVWSLDGVNNFATLHAVANNSQTLKNQIRAELKEHGITHVTIELETEKENCCEHECVLQTENPSSHHHHHHH